MEIEYSSRRSSFSTEAVPFQQNIDHFSTAQEVFFSQRTLGKISLKHELFRKLGQLKKKFHKITNPVIKTVELLWRHKYLTLAGVIGLASFTVLESIIVGVTELKTLFASSNFQILIWVGIITGSVGSIVNYAIHFFGSKKAPSKVVIADKQVQKIVSDIRKSLTGEKTESVN